LAAHLLWATRLTKEKMHISPLVIPLVVSVAVYMDAKTIGIQKGQIAGFFNMGAGMWAFACFLFLVIALPAYLLKRSAYREAIAQIKAQAILQQQGQAPASDGSVWPPPPQAPPHENSN